jgi:hypothetical protein
MTYPLYGFLKNCGGLVPTKTFTISKLDFWVPEADISCAETTKENSLPFSYCPFPVLVVTILPICLPAAIMFSMANFPSPAENIEIINYYFYTSQILLPDRHVASNSFFALIP